MTTPVVRGGLAALINDEPDLMVCGEAANVQDAMTAVTALQPDVAVVDLMLDRSSGLDLIKNLQARTPPVPILVLSMHDEVLFAERVLRAGAQGYILKKEVMDDLLKAIRQVLYGEIYLSTQMASRLLRTAVQGSRNADTGLTRLSDRELDVLALLGQGYNRRQIAEALHLSVKTVEAHRAHLMEKLHLASALELTRYAMYWLTGRETC